MTPRPIRAKPENQSIRFAIGECSLGLILVASSQTGICAISLGDEAAQLTNALHHRFPQAQPINGDPDFERLIAKVISFIEAPASKTDLPLDVRGTDFQQRVWQTLQTIPAGSTASYTDIANRIGSPQAVQAVAGACAANRLAVVIPCHRVIRTDGSLSGYRWGVKRKEELLRREYQARQAGYSGH